MMKTTRELLLHALVIALVCVVTISLIIPLAVLGVSGYFNLSDVVIMAFVVVLSKSRFALSCGIGAALADMLTPYAIYAPYTFVIKALLYILVLFSFSAIHTTKLKRTIPFILGGLWIAFGYGIADFILYGKEAFLPSLSANALQGFSAAVILILISPVLSALKDKLHLYN